MSGSQIPLTERGALLAEMEYRKVCAGVYEVEGFTVKRSRSRTGTADGWVVLDRLGFVSWARTLTEGLRVVREKLDD